MSQGQKFISVNRVMNGSAFDGAELQGWLDQLWTVNQTATAGDQSVIFILDPPKAVTESDS